MYTPKHFEEPRVEVLHDLMKQHPLATLVTFGGRDLGLVANHIPLHLDAGTGGLGTLRGHVSRSNALWKDLDPEIDALAIFMGPDAYITPSWYATKKETGQAVPTWNYVVAHAHGPIRVVHDPEWLRTHVEALTRHQEDGRKDPWRVTDAPAEYLTRLLAGIVGLEMTVTRIEGKWKVSQNQPEANRSGVVQGLRALANPQAHAMADLVLDRSPRT